MQIPSETYPMSCFSPKDKYFLTGNDDYDNQRMGQRKCIQVRTFTQWAHPLHHKRFLQPKPTSTFSTSCLDYIVKARKLCQLLSPCRQVLKLSLCADDGRTQQQCLVFHIPPHPSLDGQWFRGWRLPQESWCSPITQRSFPPKSKAAAYNDVPHPHLLQENEAVADTVAPSDFSTSLSAHVRRQLSVIWDTIAGHRRTTFLVLLRSTNTRIGGTQELSCL